MTTLISTIANLEAKQDNGTITMTEEAILCKLIEMVENLINK